VSALGPACSPANGSCVSALGPACSPADWSCVSALGVQDVWSLGLTLMECATGEYPYPTASTCIDMVQSIIESDAPALRKSSQAARPTRVAQGGEQETPIVCAMRKSQTPTTFPRSYVH
jgi:serine/threonine protein kinase